MQTTQSLIFWSLKWFSNLKEKMIFAARFLCIIAMVNIS